MTVSKRQSPSAKRGAKWSNPLSLAFDRAEFVHASVRDQEEQITLRLSAS